MILFIVAAVFTVPNLYGEIYDGPVVSLSPVISAVGGAHSTMSEGFSSLLNNPAGFVSADEEISIAELSIGLKGPVFDIANMFVSDDYSSIASIFKGIYAGVDIMGPLAFGYVGNGLGFGIISNSVNSVSSIDPLTVNISVGQEIALVGGYAFRISIDPDSEHMLDAGMLLKGVFRGSVNFNESVLNIPDISIDTVTNENFDFVTGIGFDLGLKYSYRKVFSAGLVGRDIYSPTVHNLYSSVSSFFSSDSPVDTNYGIVPFRLDAGIMYSPDLSDTNSFISGLAFYLDYYNIFDFWLYPSLAVNPVLHVGLGSQITLLEILSVRAGFYQGLFSAGLGLDLYYFVLNASMFGTELSTEPGLHPVYNVQIGVEFRI